MGQAAREALIAEWYQKYSSFLHLYVSQFIDPHSAEEIVQETFRVVCEIADIHEIRHPKTWLRKIASLVLKNWIRDRKKWKAMLINLETLSEDTLGVSEDPVNAQLVSWADMYDNCTFEAKKMIVAQFVKSISVKRDYEIDITFNVSFAEFQEISLEPETEEEKQSREPMSLALTETMRQAV